MLGRSDSRARHLLLLATLIVVAIALISRLAWWQVIRRDDLATEARLQTSLRIEIPSQRGSIFDRSGVVVLATTVERNRLVAVTTDLTGDERRALATTLTPILGLDPAGATALADKLADPRPYVVLARDLQPNASDQIRTGIADGSLHGVALEPEPARIYPQAGGAPDTTLASQLLGFVNREGVGQYGVEQRYQDVLGGSPKVVLAQKDVNANAIPETAVVTDPGVPGTDIRLTLDAGLQLAVEQELLAAWIADHAKSVSAVVMDPYTGEVYAEASYPAYDANDYRQVAAETPGRFVDPIVSQVYEPGSVFKMMTVVAALENGTVTPETRIKDVGILHLDGGRTHVDDADHRAKGWMTFEDGIAYSRNVVAAKVALELGQSTRTAAVRLHDVWLRLGFGNMTGIDVAGEVAGLVHDPSLHPWQQIDLANGSFGQGVAVTPIQLATAYSAMVNGGMLVQPHVVDAIGDRDVTEPTKGRVIDPGLTPTLIDMMNHVVSEVPFYRDRTLIPGYFVGGKTGTAQIWDSKAHRWKHNLFNYTFVGFVGRKIGKPELVIAVRVNEGRPTVARLGQLEMPVMSFELFRRIAHDAITTPALLPQRPRQPIGTTAAR
jgi:cell division protein FtsI (penicillin-binding protein 3)